MFPRWVSKGRSAPSRQGRAHDMNTVIVRLLHDVYKREGLVQHSMRAAVPLNNFYMTMKAALTWLTTALLLVASLGRSVADYQRTVSYERELVVRW